jgi:hypothetical protein
VNRKQLLAAGVSTVLVIALAEFLLGGPLRPTLHTQRDDAWQTATRDLHTALYQADADLIYRPRPGASLPMDFGEATFNEQGLREPHPILPVPTETRVLVVGDSLVWGAMLAQKDALPAALDDALGPGHEVVNLGVTGYDTRQELAWYQEVGPPLHPDIVVLVYCLNDMLIHSGPFQVYADPTQRARAEREQDWLTATAPVRNETVNEAWWDERGGDGSQVLAALRHVMRWHRLYSLPGGYVDDYLLAARDPERVRRAEADLVSFAESVRADGARPVLVISPALYWWHRYQWDEVHSRIGETGRYAGFQVIDPLEAWRDADPSEFRFTGDNLHYTAHGTRQLAAIIAESLSKPTP